MADLYRLEFCQDSPDYQWHFEREFHHSTAPENTSGFITIAKKKDTKILMDFISHIGNKYDKPTLREVKTEWEIFNKTL